MNPEVEVLGLAGPESDKKCEWMSLWLRVVLLKCNMFYKLYKGWNPLPKHTSFLQSV